MTNVDSPAPAASAVPGLALPDDLQRRLKAFRGLVWRIKIFEAAAGAAFGLLLGYLVVFGLDRLTETPQWVRAAAFAVAVAACTAVPLALHRWVWNHRAFDQLARLVARRFPSLGDQLLGIVEIVRGQGAAEFRGSRALCEAAIGQVAERSATVDFATAVPRSRPGLWGVLAAVPLVAAVAAAVLVPEAARNAWARFLLPWQGVDRYTFTRLEPLPAEIVVPQGEPAAVDLALGNATLRRPATAAAHLGDRTRLEAPLAGDRYGFQIPPQLEPVPLRLSAGDAVERTTITPLVRPEIAGIVASVRLPDYLGRPAPLEQDVRGGAVAPVEGSSVTLAATASRDLAAATVDGAEVAPAGAVVRTGVIPAAKPREVSIAWRDRHGLAGARPLVVRIDPRPDEAPVVSAAGLPGNGDVLLSSDTLSFTVAVRDDFGIRRVGLAWEGDAPEGGAAPEKGERLLKAGGTEVESLEVAATFCPDALGVRPQPLVLRAFAEDYRPGRGRAYSTPFLVYVVDRAEHALVMNERLSRWRQRASEVRDREMGLLAANTELRDMPAEQLLDPATRRRLQQQAAAEQAQARRLDRLVEEGGKLVREAIKNPEFEADTLEQLAEDVEALAGIAAERMPGVAELLEAAARAQVASAGDAARTPSEAGPTDQAATPGESGSGKPGSGKPGSGKPGSGKPGSEQPGTEELAGTDPRDAVDEPGDDDAKPTRVGEDRSPAGGGQGEQPEPGDQPQVPQVVDKESSQQPRDPDEAQPPGQPGGPGRLGLPSTQAGVAPPKKPGDEAGDEPPADEAIAAAVEAQQRLLEEFATVADDLAKVMASLEGSTFVKRLKLASREQGDIAGRIAAVVGEAIVVDTRPPEVERAVAEVADRNAREAEKVSNLMDDLQAYLDRRQLPAFRTVLEEMKDLDALGSLRALADDVRTEAGMSIAQSEFWSDTFDRLADDLVEPPGEGRQGQGGGETPESVPPEVVLETMQILEAEMNLREETRVAEQARGAVAPDEHGVQASALADRQDALADRIVGMVDRLLDEEDGERAFAREIALFEKVEEVMAETVDILDSPDTGSKAIGAETEVIELLLAAQAACGNRQGGGGGGGSAGSPGGGGTGVASTSALALVGAGNLTAGAGTGGEKEQATGVSGRVLPEEFRAGLDRYFNTLEKERR